MSNKMREILFRGKREVDNVWVYGVPYDNYIIREIDWRYEYPEAILYAIRHETVGQFTGLTDKNGNKIFEGDIIKAIWQHLSNTDTVIGVVKYDNAAFILETHDHYLFFEDNIFSYECEVINNIHDTPELLEESNENT